ncbi:hypothetical protein M378DRAFT_165002, partial [Amanita muscaria Koide BX008]
MLLSVISEAKHILDWDGGKEERPGSTVQCHITGVRKKIKTCSGAVGDSRRQEKREDLHSA